MKAYCPCFCTDMFCFRGLVAAGLGLWLGSTAWAQMIVDDSGSARNGTVGQWSSIVARAGEVGISYHCADDHAAALPDMYALRFAWWNGSVWQRTTVAPYAGTHTTMCRGSDGLYHIAYDAWTGIGIATGSGYSWSRSTVDTDLEVAPTQMSMALDSMGNPHIAYMNLAPGGDRSIRYTRWDGVRWVRGATEIVRPAVWTPTIGFSNSWFKLDSLNIPHIAFADPTDAVNARGQIRYATLQNGIWSVEDLGIVGVDPSMAIASDNMPRMLFNSDAGITFAYKDGSGWHAEVVVAGERGDGLALALSDVGQAYATFGMTANDDLYIARRESTGWVVSRGDGDGSSSANECLGGYGNAIAVDEQGTPHVSYLMLGLNGTGHRSDLMYVGPAGGAPPCIRIVQQPQSATFCYNRGVAFDAAGESATPLSYAWEWRPTGSLDWLRITDGVNGPTNLEEGFNATGAAGTALRLTGGSIGLVGTVTFRCVLTSACGVLATSDASLSSSVCCPGDFNHDGELNFFDYLDFVDAFSVGLPAADVDANGVIDFFDYLDFVDAFSAGC